GIGSLDDLEAACRTGSLRTLRGFGEKSEQQILTGIAFARKRESQFLLPVGIEIGETIREQLAQHEAIENAEISGSVRRRLEVIRNVNIAVAMRDPKGAEKFLTKIVADLESIDTDTFRGVSRNDVVVYFHIAKPADFGSTLFRTTGSQEFVPAVGALKPAKTEKELFDRAGVGFVAPERRESAEDARRKRPRPLVRLEDLRGTFHVHTTFSDGRNTVLEMLTAAK